MTTPNFDVLNKIDFISTLAADVMKRNYALVSTSELFDELNELCRNHVQQKLVEEQKRAEKAVAYSKTAQSVIERIDHYFSYSLVKNNHKMRMTSKEYHYMMDRLKTEAIFWKQEVGPKGNCWIEPTEADHLDVARWATKQDDANARN